MVGQEQINLYFETIQDLLVVELRKCGVPMASDGAVASDKLDDWMYVNRNVMDRIKEDAAEVAGMDELPAEGLFSPGAANSKKYS